MEESRLAAARELINATEDMHSETIRSHYRKSVKALKDRNELTDEKKLELKDSMFLLIRQRKNNKIVKRMSLDGELHIQIRERMTKKKKFFAPKLWFKLALPIIIWAILQEIIMASTDIVDNIFVNWMSNDQIDGLSQLRDYISSHWAGVDPSLLLQNHLSADYADLNYNAGQIAVNGVTASNQLYTIMFCVVSGACYGMGVYSAQYFGAGNKERLRNITALKFYFTISVAGVFAIFALPGITKPLIEFTTNPGADPSIGHYDLIKETAVNADNIMLKYHYIQHWAANLATEQGIKYYRFIFWSYFLLAINESIITSLRETRRPIYSFIMSIVSLATNCVLNLFLTAPKFITGFTGLGVEGTALATAISRVLQFMVIFIVIGIKRFEFFPVWSSFSISRQVGSRVILKALPIIINELLYAFGQVLIVKLKGMYSVEVLTANAMYTTVIAALLSPIYHGMNAGISVFVGNELGANRLDIAEYNANHLMKTSIVVGLIFGLLLIGLSFFVPDLLFSNANDEAKRNATWMLFSFGCVYPIFIICNGCYSILRTGGSMWGAFLMDSGMVWTIQIPLLALFILLNKYQVLEMDYIYIHVITMGFYIVQSTLAYFVYRKKTWLRNVIDEPTRKEKRLKKAEEKVKDENQV
jgi:Na+-driven multidrug efflux pump